MNLFELFVKIGVDDQASDKLSSLSSKLGNGLKTAAKIGTAAVGAAATGITAMTTAAVNNYAEYEQLVGGIETLYGNAGKSMEEYVQEVADQVRAKGFEPDLEGIAERWKALEDVEQQVLSNSSKAYKTAGLSANQYMETITGFTAALKQTIDDTSLVADYADMAVTDMSDNANKMGTSMESIQNAYQGFAKQNYTMLDNLKLGYGGTKEEMERLISDAAELSDTVDAQSLSFDNIVEAIHVVQTEMGITGTTAKEAGTTIQGSVASMKSAWTNLLTGLADGNANIEDLINNLVETVVGDGTETNLGVLGNILPAVKTALTGASKLVSKALPEIVGLIPTIINDNLPVLVESAVGIVQSLVDGISNNQEMLFTSVFDVVTYLVESFIGMLPKIVKLGLDLIVSLANGIAESLPELIPTIVDVVLQIVDTLTDPDTLSNLIDAAIAIIFALADGLIESLPELLEKAPEIVQDLANAIIKNAPKLLESAYQLIVKLVEGIRDNLPKALESGTEIVFSILEGITELIGNLIMKGKEIVDSVKKGFSSKVAEAKNWGKDLIQNFIDGITAKWQALKAKVSSVAQTVKDFLGFSEPKEGPLSDFHTYAPDMMELFAKGIKDNEKVITDQIDKSFDFGTKTIDFSASGLGKKSASIGNVATNFANTANETINIVVQSVLDGKVIGETAYQYSKNRQRAYGVT